MPLAGQCAGDADRNSADWKIKADKAGLSPADIEQLGKHKILIGRHSYKQVFTPYLSSSLPLFITTDSLLNGYHVLFEESVLRLESAQARRLPKLLGELWKAMKKNPLRLDGKADLASAARQRAQLVIGVALELLGDRAAREDRALAPLIEAEARRIIAANGTGKPKWLGPPDNGFTALDYTRYAPRGFYTRHQALQRHFRAVSWLQSIPFRIDKDEELLAALVLGVCVRTTKDPYEKWRPVCHGYQKFVGAGDDWDVLTMTTAAEGIGEEGWLDRWPRDTARRWEKPRLDLAGKDVAKIRTALRKYAAGDKGGPAINDQLAFIPDDPRQPAAIGFRVLSAYRLPDAVLFHRTTDPHRFQRPFPDGLEVCAFLGSSFARQRLQGKGDLLKVIDGSKGLLSGKSLYNDYLKCMEAILAPAKRDAPALFRSEAWQAKSCQTALAGWAQLRHTWVLQGKQNVHYLSRTLTPAGFIEPYPEFYVRLGELARRTAELLEESDALGPNLLDLAEKLRLVAAAERKDKPLPKWSLKEMNAFETIMLIRALQKSHIDLNKLADQLERDELPADPKLREAIQFVSPRLASLWKQLAELSDRLETLAHKQLREAAFDARDGTFLRGYGTALARIMLYEGNSYLQPEDDAPRVVDVFSNLTRKTKPYLEVGTGRPREFYILYPRNGREILCRGAVLPYHEFSHATRLDDRTWKALLDSREPPKPPDWLRPILSAAPR
jgi:hypothetical protein